jgi:ribosomal protein S18 acetylase RimI-like enzyme
LGAGGLIDLTFRDAEARDLPKILELTAETWDLHRTHYPEDFDAARWASTVKELQSRFDEKAKTGLPPITLIAEAKGEFVGYVTAVRGLNDRSGDRHDVTGHIDDIAVLPDCRRKGIGAQLLARMKERLRAEHTTLVKAAVWSFNADSKALFERASFAGRYTMVCERLSAPHYSSDKQTTADKPRSRIGAKPDDLALLGLAIVVAVLVILSYFL